MNSQVWIGPGGGSVLQCISFCAFIFLPFYWKLLQVRDYYGMAIIIAAVLCTVDIPNEEVVYE